MRFTSIVKGRICVEGEDRSSVGCGSWHDGGMCEQEVRVTNVRVPGTDNIVDVTIQDGMIASVQPSSNEDKQNRGELLPESNYTAAYTETINAGGRWVIPGLWDGHTHFTQWASTFGRLDLLRAGSAHEAMTMLREYLEERRESMGGLEPDSIVVGMRFRHSLWADSEQPTLAMIDEAAGGQPVALSSADMHCGWVNSAAAERLGVHVGESGLVGELEWFDAYCKLDDANGKEQRRLVKAAEKDAASKGVVGICDYEMADTIAQWTSRFEHGINRLRVRVGVYPERLESVIEEGWHGGDEIPGSNGLAKVTTLKLISDGSLNTRSAYCSRPYSGVNPPTRGVLSYTPDEIERYMTLAHEHGFDVACHAIGDEANSVVLDAFEHTGATGAIEHAQLLKARDIPRLAANGLTASIQPQHAVDDRDVVPRYWGEMIAQSKAASADEELMPFAYRSLLNADVSLRFGSDAPVAVLDPWVAMAAAVYRTDDDRPADAHEQTLNIRTALAASTFGHGTQVAEGDPADLVLLDADPYAVRTAEALRTMSVAATMCAGCWTHFAL